MRTLLRFLGILTLTAALLFVVVFFWFQSFIVYTADGIRLDIPFLRGMLDEIPEDASPYPILPAESPPPLSDPEVEPALPIEIDDFRTVFVRGADLSDIAWELAIHGLEVDGVLISMSEPSGMLWWDADVPFAHSFELAGAGDPTPYLEQMGSDITRSALLYTFHNPLLTTRHPGLALTDDVLDPAHPDVQTYLTDLALDLIRLGFDEIVLTGFALPQNDQDEEEEPDQHLLSFLSELSRTLRLAGGTLSIMTQEADWVDAYGYPAAFHPRLETLLPIIDRVYCILSPDTIPASEQFTALLTAAESVLDHAMHRFVPGAPGTRPDEGNWIVIPQTGDLF